jgi:radical SAM superfamily enzyme YgiQ (UPF0313 family)
MPRPQILLVNPPIYDFTAFDFWLRPYGMFRVAGKIRSSCDLTFYNSLLSTPRDEWGRGRFQDEVVPRPLPLSDIPRNFRRFGRPRSQFQEFLKEYRFDAALIQTGMTYWYPGVAEAIEDLRRFQPAALIVLGGPYATLCPEHALSLGADVVVQGNRLSSLWRILGVEPDDGLPFCENAGDHLGVMKISEGCPFRCTYCSVPLVYPDFSLRSLESCTQELELLIGKGARNIVFYDDALLFQAQRLLTPLLQEACRRMPPVFFHTPNALNARFLGPELAELMVRAGFKNFFLGLESGDPDWQRGTGGKISRDEYSAAAQNLRRAGASNITSYILIGHPRMDVRELEDTIRFAHKLGTRVSLSEFSPIPGTPDGNECGNWTDLKEPLNHNKTVFTTRRLGSESLNRWKALAQELNEAMAAGP